MYLRTPLATPILFLAVIVPFFFKVALFADCTLLQITEHLCLLF